MKRFQMASVAAAVVLGVAVALSSTTAEAGGGKSCGFKGGGYYSYNYCSTPRNYCYQPNWQGCYTPCYPKCYTSCYPSYYDYYPSYLNCIPSKHHFHHGVKHGWKPGFKHGFK